jgi:myo-inositol catabolism protein IolC
MNSLIKEGWEPKGSHQVVVIHSQNRYSGMQLMDTKHETEYSQTMVRETKKNVIEVDISFYHPDDNETIKVYDEEGMREEFENKLKELI